MESELKLGSVAKVTFCMTTYKRPQFLKEQLLTLFKQTIQDFKIIISDNDPDGSAEIVVKELNDPRIKYQVNEQNLGMVKSFNRSLFKADTDYVVMITDDDPVYPEMLETLFNLKEHYPGYGIYYGGCDIRCTTPEVARTSRLKVGTNSCLADLPIGAIRTFEGKDFALEYFSGRIGGHLLWSTGIVKREIAWAIGGMPDFGAAYNTDYGYVALSGARAGAVVLNTSLGCQVVHGKNYGFTEANYQQFYITPEAFYSHVMGNLPDHVDLEKLQKPLQTFIGRWVVEYAVSIKKFMRDKNIRDKNFEKYTDKIFKISFLRRWKIKYLIAIHFPNLFQFILHLKKAFAS